ncbi:MAG: hypothetical protein LVR00_01125 [Rhabdochlamydiaceae bacterium]
MHKAFPSPSSAPLLPYGKAINLEHIRCKDSTIDMSGVPDTVQVNDALTLFDEANFNDPDGLGYVNPRGTPTYLRDRLKEKTLSYINNRTPFLGTPPASDIPRLLAFYQHIENAVRFSIHTVNEDLRKFKEAHPGSVTDYDVATRREYTNLLENKARVALDLVTAGEACGARLAAEINTIYSYCAKKSNVPVGETLEDVLIELLAQKRKEIALAQINQHGKGDAHFYSQYLENMGLPLSIPGTANIIEHLSSNFNLPLYLKRFFEEYTIDCILDTVNQAIKTSEPLRRLIYDWIKDQEKDWKEEEYAALVQQRIEGIQEIQRKQIDAAEIPAALQTFSILAAKHREELSKAKNTEDWLKIIVELEEVKGTALLPLIQMLLKSGLFVKDCIDHLYQHHKAGSSLNSEDFFRKMKILEIRNLMPALEKRQVEQMLATPALIPERVRDITDRERKEEFREVLLDKNGIESILQKGLSPKLLEWIIVSHRILYPQTEETYETRGLANTEQYIQTVCNQLSQKNLNG